MKAWWPYMVVIVGAIGGAIFCHLQRRHARAQHKLRNYRSLIENLSEGIYRSSLAGRLLSANPALVRLNGYNFEAELLGQVADIGSEWYVDPGKRDEFRRLLLRNGKVENFVAEIYRHKTRERIWTTESARVVRHYKSGKPLFYEGSVREITETTRRLQIEEMFQKLTKQLSGGLFQFVRHKNGMLSMPYMSSGFRRIVNISEHQPISPTGGFLALVHPDDRFRFDESLRVSGNQMVVWDCEFRIAPIAGKDQPERWLRVSAQPEAIGDDIIWHGYLNDITVRKRHEVEIEKLAFFDPLTELPNRRLLVERMQQTIGLCATTKDCGALLFIDLDNFKTLNDTMGHEMGDQFLKLVAERLLQALGKNDLVARLGGDEFVVLLDTRGQQSAEAHRSALQAGAKILSALRRSFRLGSLEHRSSASVGIVVFDGDNGKVDEIMKGADMAMYKAKAAGRNGLALFDPQALQEEADRFRLVADLREAIRNSALELHFQPQVDAAGNVLGAEALLRWNHPARGMIPPDLFVPLSEQFGLAEDLARFVVVNSVETVKRWQGDASTSSLHLALNVSVHVVTSRHFAELLAELVRTYGIDAGKLTLEVTEHVMARDQDEMAHCMRVFKKIGVRLSLDDFGTGYSSLAYLKSLPFDELKIDGSFVSEIEKAGTGRALVKTIMAMARMLGMTAVAEHVETETQQSFLRALGCQRYQGWLYSRALPLDQFEAFVRSRAASPEQSAPGTELRRLA